MVGTAISRLGTVRGPGFEFAAFWEVRRESKEESEDMGILIAKSLGGVGGDFEGAKFGVCGVSALRSFRGHG